MISLRVSVSPWQPHDFGKYRLIVSAEGAGVNSETITISTIEPSTIGTTGMNPNTVVVGGIRPDAIVVTAVHTVTARAPHFVLRFQNSAAARSGASAA
jgi:hypothetical protein